MLLPWGGEGVEIGVAAAAAGEGVAAAAVAAAAGASVEIGVAAAAVAGAGVEVGVAAAGGGGEGVEVAAPRTSERVRARTDAAAAAVAAAAVTLFGLSDADMEAADVLLGLTGNALDGVQRRRLGWLVWFLSVRQVVCARPAVASGAEGNAEPSLVVGMSTLLLLQPWPCTKGLFAEFRVVFLDVQFAPAIGVAHQAVHSCSV